VSYTLTIPLALGSSQTGLTLRAKLWPAGGSLGSAVTTGFREMGSGAYDWTGTIPNGFQGSVLFYDNGTGDFKASTSINPADDPQQPVSAVTGNVGGDVVGGVLGNTTGLINGPGVWALSNDGSTLATAAVAAAVKAKTDNLPAAPASTTNITAASGVQLAANQDVRNVTGSVTGAVTVGALNDGVITDAKFTMPAEANGRPSTFMAIVRRLLELMPGGNKRNRDRSTGAVTLRNAADTGNLQTWTQSTDGTVDTESKGA
jgi:hypothetical protein